MMICPYISYLRVYEPEKSFKFRAKQNWDNYPDTFQTVRDEQLKSIQSLILYDGLNLTKDGLFYLVYNKEKYISPWSTKTRCSVAFQNFKSLYPYPIFNLFIPKNIEASLNSDFLHYGERIFHIQTSNWKIPPGWFSLFRQKEKISGVNNSGHFLIYRTSISNALRRSVFTHQVILRSFGEGVIEREIYELNLWLGMFDRNSIVELDYGGLATLLHNSLRSSGEAGIEADTSIEDIESSISGLASGDRLLASKGYERFITRWGRIMPLEFSN